MSRGTHEAACGEDAVSLRITVPQTAKTGHRPLYEAIVEEARRRGLAGATVLRGTMGLDAKGGIRKARVVPLSEDLPLVIEIVDMPERIGTFLQDIHGQGLLAEGMVAVRNVRRITRRARGDARPSSLGQST